MDSFGAYLKGFRESKGIRLEEIASITKIHLHNLELLEADRWEKLPPDPFLRGFIVAYGKYVGLDTKELLGRYLESLGNGHSGATTSAATTAEVSDTSPPPGDLIDQGPALSTRKLMGGLGIFLIVGLLGGIVYLGKRATDQSLKQQSATSSETATIRQNATEPESAVPAPVVEAPRAAQMDHAPVQAASPVTSSPTAPAPVVAVAPEVKTPAAPQTAAATPAAPATVGTNHKISIEGSERTWIKVVVDESAPIEYFLPQGDKVAYQAKDKIKVVLGNATGAKVYYNGKVTEGVNFLGTIRSYKFPADAEFPQDTTSRRMPTSAEGPAREPAPNGRAAN